jgi:hypothetical protein
VRSTSARSAAISSERTRTLVLALLGDRFADLGIDDRRPISHVGVKLRWQRSAKLFEPVEFGVIPPLVLLDAIALLPLRQLALVVVAPRNIRVGFGENAFAFFVIDHDFTNSLP